MEIKTSEWNLATKLIVVNLSAILVLGAILSLVFISFKNIETSVSEIVKKEVPQVIDNSQIGNELTGMFADLLMSMLYEQEEMTKRKSDGFEQTLGTIAIQDVNPRLQASLEEFRPKLVAIFDQFSLIRELSEKFKIIEGDFIYELESLQDSIAEQMEMLDEASPVMRYMEQLKSMGTRYRETFLEITLQVAALRGGKIDFAEIENHPVISDLNYLNLSLETLLAADSEIREQGRKLMKIMQDYKESLIQFLNIVATFQQQLKTVSDSKDHVMAILMDTNEQIAATAGEAQKQIDSRTRRTKKIIIVLSAGILVVGLLITYSVLNTFKVESNAKLLAREMELAKKIQTSLLPDLSDNVHPDLEISAAMIPADQVGGDFYDLTFDRSGHLWFAIGDVSGHGVTPGLIMMMAQTIHTTITASLDCDARGLVVKLNEILYKNVHDRLKETHFMTFTGLKYLGEGRFQHAGAHLSMIVFREKTQACELVRTRGVYLNFKQDISKATKNKEFSLDAGDVLVLYTDGLTEAENQNGEMLDLDGFVNIVETCAHQDPRAMKDMIMAEVIRWCHDNRADDMTLVIVKRKIC